MDKHTQLLSMEAIYEEYFPVVYNYVYYKLLNREHCEDLVSQIFLKVVQNLYRYDPALATMRTWLLRITDNALIIAVRSLPSASTMKTTAWKTHCTSTLTRNMSVSSHLSAA